MGKVETSQHYMIPWTFSAWGIQTGPFAAYTAPFVPRKFHVFHFHSGGHFLFPQRDNNGKIGILPTLKWNDTMVFQCLGHSKCFLTQ